ncbi:elongation factor Tu [Striga asiatica]|uniref:Elongation factor Tu n=1 Tax=Striga asiatica TaxID=4170 RepID=A0A5A7R9S2_STRAF|nr:elongation factor Tu [Striga asiatica]
MALEMDNKSALPAMHPEELRESKAKKSSDNRLEKSKYKTQSHDVLVTNNASKRISHIPNMFQKFFIGKIPLQILHGPRATSVESIGSTLTSKVSKAKLAARSEEPPPFPNPRPLRLGPNAFLYVFPLFVGIKCHVTLHHVALRKSLIQSRLATTTHRNYEMKCQPLRDQMMDRTYSWPYTCYARPNERESETIDEFFGNDTMNDEELRQRTRIRKRKKLIRHCRLLWSVNLCEPKNGDDEQARGIALTTGVGLWVSGGARGYGRKSAVRAQSGRKYSLIRRRTEEPRSRPVEFQLLSLLRWKSRSASPVGCWAD